MYHYSSDSIHKLSALLERSALSLGVSAVQIKDTIFPMHVAMDPIGPLSWALTLHAQAIVAISGIAQHARGNVLPFACVNDPAAPYGNQVVIQPAVLPLSVGLRFLDAALEHAACLGMRDLGYTPEEWQLLPENQRAIPLEPYFNDLTHNWVTDALERGDLAMQLANWPELLDQASLSYQMSQNQGVVHEQALRFPSAR
ncbi:hypothetical protein [Ectopseudomonas mendocina]|jgi:hypothetical protein|uniref:Uncharacterized protein n=2 Tax=Ectopseudomonas TaxID=3236654 RepID=A0A1G6Q9R8_9GAMM|nr:MULTISPECIES: hypothetical protein [Pseudomonas]CRN64471.1 hypothetical protein PAERUG_P40_Scotland_4_VIM_2_09_12_04007 [Pseudomonas aeruginosa]SDC88426.1 hypothetical protein SAMN05216576_107305 [Pseudomonas chengduensis]ALN21701.1 hypothetical protein DW68_023755 [Pseudomonas mendocina S5.2]KER98231.1 hypothetical protein HN51_25980 [Pseudomonas mendocina]OEO24327.1 hypothetical protein AX279_16780 [Pseudomonas sp. J237]